MNHSPLPWGIARLFVLDASNGRVCEMTGYGTGEDDAVFIVHAVNNIERVESELSRVKEVNEKLMEALRSLWNSCCGTTVHKYPQFEKARALLNTLSEAAKMKGDL